ncbi:sulfatase-like hydrolase/transferase, partial [candidate division KSB1 bacterium]|nr:sulfatase-like hydrolase/transferase [candidate division KSB1 bacterium]
MNRRTFIKQSGLAAASLSVAPKLFGSASSKQKRNIILYVVDDQGTGDAGCYGNPVINTPGLDHLAENGIRFTNAFCTTASCSPSRSVILSGLHNHANGMFGLHHAVHHFQSFENFKSLPVRLGEAGYRTLCAGKYHVGPEPVYHFDEYLNFKWVQRKNGKWLPEDTPADLADKCEPLISSDSDKPFFLYFCTIAPHRPFLREGIDPVSPDDVIVPPYLPDIPECREELAQYYMSVERADSGLLRLIDILKKTNQWDDTLIIYCSDNG